MRSSVTVKLQNVSKVINRTMGWSRYGDKGTVQKILVVKYDGKISLGR
jgi:hypothetical protein